MIVITAHPEGWIVPVRAQPGARKNSVVGEHGGALKVAVMAPPDGGRANKALLEVLAKALEVKRAQVELISGATSRDKRFLVRGLHRKDLEQRIDELTRS